MDLKTRAGRLYGAYLREQWKRRPYAEMMLAGTPVRFQGLGAAPFDWFGYEMHRGRWERGVLAFYASSIRSGDVILDVGAFIGAYALLGSKLVGEAGRVFAFEPDPVARQQLDRNIAVNDASNVEVIAAAVSDSNGEITLDTSHLGSSETQVGSAAGLTVPAVALDQFCEGRGIRPNVLKIDVEGAEQQIVGPSSEKTLSEARAVVVEIHEGRGADSARILRHFAGFGKQPIQLDERWAGQYNVGFV